MRTGVSSVEELQWAPQVTHVLDMPVGFGIGGLVINKEIFAGLPPEAKAALQAAKVELEGQAPPGAEPDPIEIEMAAEAAGKKAEKKAGKGKKA